MTVKLEVGKVYKNHAGDKCTVYKEIGNTTFMCLNHKYDIVYLIGLDGKLVIGRDDNSCDIISEWTEPMTETPPTKTLRDEFAMAAIMKFEFDYKNRPLVSFGRKSKKYKDCIEINAHT